MLSQGFNLSLQSQVDALEVSLGLDIRTLDVYNIGKQLSQNPGGYGFSNTTQSALLTGNAANADQYLYWDTVHPTARVHDIFGQRARDLYVPEAAAVSFVLAIAVGTGLRRRRTPGL